jgi:hypothetical protein
MTSTALAERYGTDRRWHGRAVAAGAALVVLAFGGWLAWTTYVHATPQVTSQLESFTFPDEHTATAALVVDVGDGTTDATCTLRAFAADHSVVGELRFTPEPGVRRQVQDVRTERLATSIESLGCTAAGQNRPR